MGVVVVISNRVAYYFGSNDVSRILFADTDAGCTAKCMMEDPGVDDINLKGTVQFAAMLPSPGSDDEPTWLANCRQAVEQNRRYLPNQDDMSVLSRIPCF